MSDVEEPPAKVTKIEVGPASLESTGEAQEEWLSEGVLTDDDYNPRAEQDKSDSNIGNTSQDDSNMTGNTDQQLDSTADGKDTDLGTPAVNEKDQKIEMELNKLENSQNDALPDELDAFLVRKPDAKVEEDDKASKHDDKAKESELDESMKHSDEDGHSTDDLLRMLEEDDQKGKNKVLKIIKTKVSRDTASSDDDDDQYIFEGAKVTRLKMAKNALIRKYPPKKAEPEDMSDKDSDSDMTSDEASTMKKMFGVAKASSGVTVKSATVSSPSTHPKTAAKQANDAKTDKLQQSTAQRAESSSAVASVRADGKRVYRLYTKPEPERGAKPEPDEIIDEEEFLEEDDFDLDDEFAQADIDEKRDIQRLMKPEEMDEEVPTDGESHSEDGSLYDELPSSDSEDLEEWFTLDIRAERAGDYLPLLGSKAHQLLTEEKARVSSRLETLRQNLSTLTETGKQQAEQLRDATMTLAEVDAMLAAV